METPSMNRLQAENAELRQEVIRLRSLVDAAVKILEPLIEVVPSPIGQGTEPATDWSLEAERIVQAAKL